MVKMTDSLGPISEKDIVELESIYKIQLPINYRNFLIKYNGGRPEPDCFNFKDGTSGSDINMFFGLCKDYNYNLTAQIEIFKDRIPYSLFSIAEDSGGNIICIGIKGEYLGKIYFWDHELEADVGEVPDFSNITLIADSFQEFLDGLYDLEV